MFDEFTFAWRYGPYIRFNFDGRSYQVETPLTDVLAFKGVPRAADPCVSGRRWRAMTMDEANVRALRNIGRGFDEPSRCGA